MGDQINMPNNALLPEVMPLGSWLNLSESGIGIIAGPCSAESEEQVINCARELAQNRNVGAFRTGIWKPRTRPEGFEGAGEIALNWLDQAREETKLPYCIEVASARHAEIALKHHSDYLWLGARTTVNPFLVQEIADVLKGTNIPVLVKNPVNPDLELWIGSLERLYKSGITKLAAVHRGFSFYRKGPYRNSPMWELPIELKSRCPNLPILTDPSHIAGNRALLKEISQKAINLEMDGLMIEVHPNPNTALTDKNQQITPKAFAQLLDELILRKKRGNQDFEIKLEQLRSEIDKLDSELIHILARRMQIIDEIGHYKKTNDITILQIGRWRELASNRVIQAENMGLSREFITSLLNTVHDESIRRQEVILGNSNNKEDQC